MGELTGGDGLLEVLDCLFLVGEAAALLVVEPAELLKDARVVGVALEDAVVGGLGIVILAGVS